MKALDRFPISRLQSAVFLGNRLCRLLTRTGASPSPSRSSSSATSSCRATTPQPSQEITPLLRTRPGRRVQPRADPARRPHPVRPPTSSATSRPATSPGPTARWTSIFIVVDYPNVIEDIVFEGRSGRSRRRTLTPWWGSRPASRSAPCSPWPPVRRSSRSTTRRAAPSPAAPCVEGDEPGDTRIVFNITEGPQVFVTRHRLRSATRSSAAPCCGRTSTVVARLLGLNLLEQAVQRRRWPTPTPTSCVSTTAPSASTTSRYRARCVGRRPKTVVLVFHINEGLRYRVKATRRDHRQHSACREELGRVVQVKADEYLQPGQGRAATSRRIQDYIGLTGPGRTSRTGIFFTGRPARCTCTTRSQERPPAKVGQIFIVGNERDQAERHPAPGPALPRPVADLSRPARRPSATWPGSTSSRPAPRRRPARRSPCIDPDDPTTRSRTSSSTCRRRSTGSLLFGVGVNSDAGLTGSIVLNERNFDISRLPTSFDDLLSGRAFRGAGQEFRIEAVPGTQLQRYTVSFREPFLFDSPYSLRSSGYYYTAAFNEYNEDRARRPRHASAGSSTDYWTRQRHGPRRERRRQQRAALRPAGLPRACSGDNFLVGLRGGVTRDTPRLVPAADRGQPGRRRLRAGASATTPSRWSASSAASTSRSTSGPTAAAGTCWRCAASVGCAGDNTPVYERFFAGGFRSIRGFQFRGVGPDINGFKVGGDFMFLNSLEYQVPVQASDKVFLVGFVDSRHGRDRTSRSRTTACRPASACASWCRCSARCRSPWTSASRSSRPTRDREQVFSFWLGFFR